MLTADAQRYQIITKLEYWLNEIVFWGLVIQALRSIFQSLKTIFIQMPASEENVSLLINDALVSVFSSIISILLVTWFARSKTQGGRFRRTALGVIGLIINQLLWRYLANQSSLVIVETIVDFF
jgi:uncharacterized membrane protein YeaQ/YmgE (transglycosylase-associated protein family)